MKLNEIKTISKGTESVQEGVIPVHIPMTLNQIISAGKVTNSVQYFILAGLIHMFKDGQLTRWPRDLNAYAMSTSADLIDEVKSLSDSESVDLAKWLLAELHNPANFESNPYACSHPQMNTVEWVKWVLKKQD